MAAFKEGQKKTKEQMVSVSKARPCPVCGKDHKCSGGDGGLILCGRTAGEVDGFVHLGPAAGDPQFHLYRADQGHQPPAPRGQQIRRPSGPTPAKRPADWEAEARRLAGLLTPARRHALAEALGIPASALAALPLVGYDPKAGCWTIPEYGPNGQVVGIGRRFPGGKKRQVAGGERGLIVPLGWVDRPGPVFLAEGASDALAGAAAGLAVIGRPSNTGRVEYLAALAARLPADRPLVVLGENDAKPNGSWPGRDGAVTTAAGLRERLGRPVEVALPPDGAKDFRAWLTARTGGPAGDWAAAGQEFLDRLSTLLIRVSACRPRVVIVHKEHETNDHAAAALAGVEGLYQRGGRLVRVVSAPPSPQAVVRRPPGPRVDLVLPATLRDILTRAAEWLKPGSRDGDALVPAHPPGWAVQAVHERGHWENVPPLEMVLPYPVLLPDGRVLDRPGYDAGTGLLYLPRSRDPLGVTADPDRDACRAAASRLLEVVDEMPFVGPAHRSAWLAAVLTPLARFAFHGPAPLFLIEANTPGSGKTLLARLAGLIATGGPPAASAYPAEAEEPVPRPRPRGRVRANRGRR